MATTKIWDVKGWLGKVVIYIENPAKTENPAFYQKADMTETQAQGLTDVIEYAVDSNKTEMQYYVSALNCSTLTARNEMMAVKKRYGKEDGIVVFHKNAVKRLSPLNGKKGCKRHLSRTDKRTKP